MDSVGIRDLKTHLSRYLKRVRAGSPLRVTEHGRTIATISPAPSDSDPAAVRWARRLVADGRAEWAGGKPAGVADSITLKGGPPLSASVLDDRR